MQNAFVVWFAPGKESSVFCLSFFVIDIVSLSLSGISDLLSTLQNRTAVDQLACLLERHHDDVTIITTISAWRLSHRAMLPLALLVVLSVCSPFLFKNFSAAQIRCWCSPSDRSEMSSITFDTSDSSCTRFSLYPAGTLSLLSSSLTL